MAWLHARPKPPRKDEKPPPKSRMEMYEGSMIAKIPELEYCDYIFELWGKVGMCSSGMSGAVPLSWGDVNNWCEGNKLDLWPTERQLIVRLSEAYVSQLNKSDDTRELPPIAIDEDGETDYGILGQMHMLDRDRGKEKPA